MKLVVFIPCLASSIKRVELLNELFACIENQTVHATEYILCITGKYMDEVKVPSCVTVYKWKKSSQFLQLRYAYKKWKSTTTTINDTYITFSDADDLWENNHIEQTLYLINKCIIADGFVLKYKYSGWSLNDKKETEIKSEASIEYYLMTVKACIVDKFFELANENLLKHSFADKAFVRWTCRNYKIANIDFPATYFYRLHTDSMLENPQKVKDVDECDCILFLYHCTPEFADKILKLSSEEIEYYQLKMNNKKRIYGTNILTDYDFYSYQNSLRK